MRAVSLLVLLTALTCSAAADPLGGDVEKFGNEFNATAKSIKNPARVAKSSCREVVRRSCRFVVTDKIEVVALSMEDKKTLGQVTIYMNGSVDGLVPYFRTVDVLLKMYAPKSDADERRVILGQLVEQIANKPAPKVTLDGLDVSVTLIPGVSSITTVGRGDIGLDSTAEPLTLN